MSLPIKLICPSKDKRKNGTSVIYFQYCYSAERRTLLNTEIAIPGIFWNEKKRCIKNTLPEEFGDPQALNEELNRQNRLLEDLVKYAGRNKIENPGGFVKQAFKPNLDLTTLVSSDQPNRKEIIKLKFSKNSFFDQLDEYIQTKKNKVSRATNTVFENVKYHLKAFEEFRKKKIEFKSLDYDFYSRFVDFLTFDYIHRRRKDVSRGLKINSIGKTIKQLRVFIKDRMRRKLIDPIDLTDFKIPEEEPDAVYLSYEEIGKIYNLDLYDNPELEKYRNLFVLGCLTGLRFSDFSILKPEDLRNDMLYKKQVKSHHWVVIPLRRVAKDIFTKEFQEQIVQVCNPYFNKNIKVICQMAGITEPVKFSYKKANKNIVDMRPKNAWITSHTCRRSFCTNEFLAGTPVDLIMKISGHKSLRDFYRYIRITPEEAGQKIKEIWENRGDMSFQREKLNGRR